ncbi:phosphonate ABC transporter, permease protein PhnE [Streptomyces avicenniae]|uniref:phosphonate ABC transporter, permease protein PhnE n=1 Tax=Streptomyces avicenniae TaxID=500153 RepID=UPI00069CA281|nr:phosphonate ABC transporter, permease protein PhnE [Streptomyces avicenniae]
MAEPGHAGPGPARPPVRPPVRPPLTARHARLTAAVLLALAAVVTSAVSLDVSLTAFTEGAEDVGNLIDRMLPARLDEPGRIVDLAVETLLIAVLGTVLATVLSVPLAFLAARNTGPGRLVRTGARGVITFCRAVPDLVFAVLLVRAMGIGVLPGVLALGLHSVGMLGKVFAEAIEDSDPGPREAARATGAGRLQELAAGVLPQVVPAWISLFVYRIDINLRTSVVLGFVGAGGIGFALQDALRGLVYDRALGIVVVILVIIAGMELLSIGLRRLLLTRPVAGRAAGATAPRDTVRVTAPWSRERIARFGSAALLAAVTVHGLFALEIDPREVFTSLDDIADMAGRMLPPDFTAVGGALTTALLETLAIGVVATAAGVVLSIPLGLLAAHPVAPHPLVYWGARATILGVRAIPELVLAIVFVAAIGLGPLAGAAALAVGSVGFLGKLVADAAEEIDPGPLEAVRAVGGGWWQRLSTAVVPQVVPSLVGSSLYLLDVNIRASTVLGIVGAGGVGFLLFEAVRTLNFAFAGGIVLLVFVVVIVVERCSGWLRRQVR